ncbi:molecular chaperone DnaJ [Atopobium fossor]|uniref:molecular chaperone DnaJ n=1 Tax=Atopobium fossor TaxID=39487 RepID=UPI00040A8D05|nr:molecular chaperone DnaJ [Atopobium fossor]
MAASKDYYDILGVNRDADAKTIKRAFLKLARQLHPDVSNEPNAEEKFKEVNEAYSVLSDEKRRANYDQFGNPDGPSGFGGDYVDMSDIFGGFGMDDLFSSFFGGMGGSAGARSVRTRGRDMGLNLHITLEEAACGCTKTVAYDRLAPCDDCGGTGVGEGGKVTACDHCQGTGRVVTVQQTILGQMKTQTTCPECGGTGKAVEGACETCGGQGRTPSRETVEVKIPAGIHSGQSIRIKGRGEAGVRGEVAGDLVVTISVSEHEHFQRQGDDLYYILKIDAFEAMVGITHTIAGILADEKVEVVVPAGCQYGQQLVIARYGMPRLHSSARGNLIIAVEVSVPVDLTDEQVQLVRSLLEQQKSQAKEAVQVDDDSDDEMDMDTATSAFRRPFGKKKRPRKGHRK